MKTTIKGLAALSRAAPYNEDGKKKFKREAMGFLRRLANDLNLDKNDYDIRFNPGGIGVPGDATLHHERLYVNVGDCIGGMIGLARSCKGRKDYTGGVNNPILTIHDYVYVLQICRQILRAQDG